jgi:hypothetical protein
MFKLIFFKLNKIKMNEIIKNLYLGSAKDD